MHLIIKLISTNRHITIALYYIYISIQLDYAVCTHCAQTSTLTPTHSCFRYRYFRLLLCDTFQFSKASYFPCSMFVFISFHFLFILHWFVLSTQEHLAHCHQWIDHLKSGSIGLRMIFSPSFDFASTFIYLFIFSLVLEYKIGLRLCHSTHVHVHFHSCPFSLRPDVCCSNDSHFLIMPFPSDLTLSFLLLMLLALC